MATIAEQLAAAAITDTLKHSSQPSNFTTFPWSASSGAWGLSGWKPSGFGSSADGEGTGGKAGAYSNTEKIKGNAFTSLTRNSANTNAKERQVSVWLFAQVENATPDGYQLMAYCASTSEN